MAVVRPLKVELGDQDFALVALATPRYDDGANGDHDHQKRKDFFHDFYPDSFTQNHVGVTNVVSHI